MLALHSDYCARCVNICSCTRVLSTVPIQCAILSTTWRYIGRGCARGCTVVRVNIRVGACVGVGKLCGCPCSWRSRDSNIHVHVIMNEHTYSRHHSLWLCLSSVHKHRILRLNCNHTLEILCFASTSMPRWRGLGNKETFTTTHKRRCEVSLRAVHFQAC